MINYKILAPSKLAQVTASNFYSGYGSSNAPTDSLVDRQRNNLGFNSEHFAPQFVQLELPSSFRIYNVCMLVSQSPSDPTQHQLFIGYQ